MATNNVFSLPCDLPTGNTALETKMVLKIKESSSENVPQKYKARLCAKGYRQVFGIDYFETYAPVAAYNSLRLFLSLMCSLDYEIDSVDVITAFLLAKLDESIYIKIPDGYTGENPNNKGYLKLQKSLYGLKQAPNVWNQALDSHLRSLGFAALIFDRCVYRGKFQGNDCFILLYVDDMLLSTPNRHSLAELKQAIYSKYPIEDNGPIDFFLNMHFKRNRSLLKIEIHQQPKISALLEELNLSDCIPAKTPADSHIQLNQTMSPTEPLEKQRMETIPYKRIVGKLLYISITARPDISTAVSAVGRYAHNPGPRHWEGVLRIVKYLKGTKNYVLQLSGARTIVCTAYADADWGGDLDKRRSRSGYCVSLNNSLITWNSKLQKTNALSTTEAELMALTSAAQMSSG